MNANPCIGVFDNGNCERKPKSSVLFVFETKLEHGHVQRARRYGSKKTENEPQEERCQIYHALCRGQRFEFPENRTGFTKGNIRNATFMILDADPVNIIPVPEHHPYGFN